MARTGERSLTDWAVLGVVSEGPTYGWQVVRTLAPAGELGRVWTVSRAIVYRSLTTLAADGSVEETGEVASTRGPTRTMVRVTPAGRAALRRWLETPTAHVRDVRTELLLKLAFLARRNAPSHDLIVRQLEELAPVFDAVNKQPTGEGFDRVLDHWRREQAAAVQRFLRVMADS